MSITIDRVKEYLDRLERVRETMIKQGRDVINLCRTIIAKVILGEETNDVVNKLRELFARLYDDVKPYPELAHSNTFYSIAAEYVEALQFHSIVKQHRVLSLDEIGMHPVPYLLGLAEVVGELKRLSLEFTRRNRFDKAYKLLEMAEEIYSKLSMLSYPDALLPGFRRKLDLYRKVIDDWKKFLIDMDSRRNLIYRLNSILRQVEPRDMEDIVRGEE